MRKIVLFVFFFLYETSVVPAAPQPTSTGTADSTVVFQGSNGIIAVEAEHFYRQEKTDIRKWYLNSPDRSVRGALPDVDVRHFPASNGAYLEALPDTRTTHDDLLVHGENFSNQPGAMAILRYKILFDQPGRYYVWVRTFSTGTEDNSLHVGINGQWPESGARLQWVHKHGWNWSCRQRTNEVHTGVPMAIYLDIDKPGIHDVAFSMREDGVEFDKFILSREKSYEPESTGPEFQVHRGQVEDLSLISPPVQGTGGIRITGELRQWHKVTVELQGPQAWEWDDSRNPFTDYNLMVTFRHVSGSPVYRVPGYFAADGNAAETGADEGNIWRAHLAPDKTGTWTYEVSMVTGKYAALSAVPWEKPAAPYHGMKGSFVIEDTDKTGRDFRSKGRLAYVGKHHLQFKGSGDYFLKAGPDAPETLLGFADFDGTTTRKQNVPLKTFQPHVRDWKAGDPVWQQRKGKGLVGVLNYLSDKGINSVSFLTYNAGGDGDNVWPFAERNEKFRYDCSKLDQWQLIFDHAQRKGLHLHFKLQETENDDNTMNADTDTLVVTSLDGGDLGPERRLYLRELVARFGYLLALNWNLGEENTQTADQQLRMGHYIAELDPYDHPIVIHTYPNKQEAVYPPLLGNASPLTGASLQNSWNKVHERTLRWVRASAEAGKPWVVANDEQGSHSEGVPPDPGYPGFDPSSINYDLHDIRKQTLWGNLMAGGAGVEYYFGYKLPENDLLAEDLRSRDRSWDYCRVALDFFSDHAIPFWEMTNHNELIGNKDGTKDQYCLAKKDDVYLIYLAYASQTTLDLSHTDGRFSVRWFNPRKGGTLVEGRVKQVKGGRTVDVGPKPADPQEDWVVLIRRIN